MPLIQEVLDALHIQHLSMDGFEADDIIATLTTQALADDFEVLILTGDRDSMQLVTEHSTVLYPMRGVSDLARLTPEAVQTKYSVSPARYPELAALVGEDSDNLPGVPGVGPKTAAKWLAQYDGLDNLIDRVEEVGGKAGDNLRAHLDDVIRNRRLNALVRDLTLPVEVPALARQPWDRHEVHTLFDSLEFRVLRDRLFETLESEEEIDESGFSLEATRIEPGGLSQWLEAHAGDGARVGVHVEGRWRAGSGDVDSIAWATDGDAAAFVTVDDLTPEDDAALGAWLADAEKPKVWHDAKGPLLALAARGWVVRGLSLIHI